MKSKSLLVTVSMYSILHMYRHRISRNKAFYYRSFFIVPLTLQDHECGTSTVCLSTSQLSLVLTASIHKGMARLSCWLPNKTVHQSGNNHPSTY